MKSTIKMTLQVAAAIIFASALAPLAQGQQGSDPRASIDRILRARQRQFELRKTEEELRRPAERLETQLAIAQIKEDYVRIQVINNDLVRVTSGGTALDLKFIAKSASEIKKRAARLKYNLALPEPEKDAKRPKAEVGELKSSLALLSKLIVGFVNNPMFKAANIVDAQESANARRDLEAIIALSGQVKKSSEQLHKEAQQSQ